MKAVTGGNLTMTKDPLAVNVARRTNMKGVFDGCQAIGLPKKAAAHQPPPVRVGTHDCPGCSSPTVCDLSKGKSVCWCFSEPQSRATYHAMKLDDGEYCLCKSCLSKAQS